MPWDRCYKAPHNRRLGLDAYTEPGRVCFLTIRAHAGLSPFTNDQLNTVVLTALHDSCAKDGCDVYTYCLMPDHLHLLVAPRLAGSSVLTFADRFKGRATRASWAAGWEGRLWQPRYHDHVLRAGEDVLHVATYILANPVRRGLVASPEDWPWSGELVPLPLP